MSVPYYSQNYGLAGEKITIFTKIYEHPPEYRHKMNISLQQSYRKIKEKQLKQLPF